MIGYGCCHRRCLRQPSAIAALHTKRPYWPTEIIAVHWKISHRVMYIPVFGKTVAFAYLAGIAVAIRTIMSFHESGIDRIASRRCFYSSSNLGLAAEDCRQINLDQPTFSSRFVNRSILQLWRDYPARTFRPAGLACTRRRDFLPISLQNSPFVRSIFIRSNQIHNATFCP